MNEFIESRWNDLTRAAKQMSPVGYRELLSSLADELYGRKSTAGIRDMFQFSCSRMRWIKDHRQQYGVERRVKSGETSVPFISHVDMDEMYDDGRRDTRGQENMYSTAAEEVEYDEIPRRVRELMHDGFGEKRAEQYLRIKKRAERLDLPERLLFERYWILGMTGMQIAKETNEPKNAIYKLLREIKEKLTCGETVKAKKNNRSK